MYMNQHNKIINSINKSSIVLVTLSIVNVVQIKYNTDLKEPKIKVLGVTDTSYRFEVEHYGYDDDTFCSRPFPEDNLVSLKKLK